MLEAVGLGRSGDVGHLPKAAVHERLAQIFAADLFRADAEPADVEPMPLAYRRLRYISMALRIDEPLLHLCSNGPQFGIRRCSTF
jgi:hypothetical protein